ncbi:MAG: hypothetical protein DRO10_01175 [Thermoprotei archaeon]|nr:MAG: hypothetical protein DRO10_01175 [Thermoprotei archaeon]
MVKITVEVSEEVLKKVLKKYPGLTPEEAVLKILEGEAGQESSEKGVIEEEIAGLHSVVNNLQRLVRVMGDTVNSYSKMLSDINVKMAQMMEILQDLSMKVEESKKGREQSAYPLPEEARPSYRGVERRRSYRGRERRKSAIEILGEQKVMYESEIAKKINNRDAFFDRLRRDGAIVLALKNQRVAVDRAFWEEFLKKVEELDTNREDQMKQALGKVGYELLKELSNSALAYFDLVRKKWVVNIEE